MNGGKNVEGSGHGRQRMNSRHTARRTGTAGKHSRRILRPAQASNKRPQMTGLAAKQPLPDDVGLSPCR